MSESSLHVVEISTTVASQSAAEQISAAMLEQRVAACVQISGPITSKYRWKGSVHSDQEFALRIKTSVTSRQAAIEFLQKNHPYELPEILVAVVDASEAYAQWVIEQTQ